MENIEDEVLAFFKNKISKKVSKNYIINSPEFLSDEATFLMEDFIIEFKIGKGYLEIDKYFNPLPVLNLKHFWNLITFNLPKSEQKYPIITIAHMIEVAKRREWFDPE